MCLHTYSSTDTNRFSIKAAIGLSLKSIHKYFTSSQKKKSHSCCSVKSSSGLNNFCRHSWTLTEITFFFYLCLTSTYMIIWHWYISQLGLFYLFTFFWCAAFVPQVDWPVIQEQGRWKVNLSINSGTFFSPNTSTSKCESQSISFLSVRSKVPVSSSVSPPLINCIFIHVFSFCFGFFCLFICLFVFYSWWVMFTQNYTSQFSLTGLCNLSLDYQVG